MAELEQKLEARRKAMELIDLRRKAIWFLEQHYDDRESIEVLKYQEFEAVEAILATLKNKGHIRGFTSALDRSLDVLRYNLQEAKKDPSVDNVDRLFLWIFAEPDLSLETFYNIDAWRNFAHEMKSILTSESDEE